MVGGRGALHVQASKGIHLVVPARPDPLRGRLHRAHRDVGALRDPVGPALDHRHHRHPVGPRQGAPGREPRRHRLRPRPRQRDPARAARPRRRRGRLRRPPARCCPASPSRPRGSPASTPWSRRCPGLVMIAGGKLTTYRVMARDAVDAAAHSLRTTTNLTLRPSITDRVPLRRRRRLRDPHQPAGPAGPPLRPARGPDRPPARPLRRPGRRPARAGRRRARAGAAAGGRRGLPRRRGRLRRHPRGRPAPRRRADPAYPHLDRDLRPRRPAPRRPRPG